MKKTTIRIAQEVTGYAGNLVTGPWPTTAFFVRRRDTEEAIEVHSPEEARAVSSKMAEEIGGRVYLGQLPKDWQQQLSDIARS